ncbi:MAG: hypothetical protein QNK04_22820 [Myxococcota bacterium]|nr:hypothetical protein [Myxococcota bacterium]
MARVIVGVLLGAGFLAALVLTTLRETRVECEVCIEYGGRTECRAASGGDVDQARMQALTSVCAVLASGVTRGLECQRTPPRSVRCTP